MVASGDGIQTQVVWLQAPRSVSAVLGFLTEPVANVHSGIFLVLFWGEGRFVLVCKHD